MAAANYIDLYERLINAPDEKTRARHIVEAMEVIESRYPHLPDLATRTHLSETELRLQKEIEEVRLDIAKVRSDLTKEIEGVRLEVEKVRSDLTKEIEGVRLEVEKVRSDLTKEIEGVRANLMKEIAQVQSRLILWSFIFWITQFSAVFAILWRVFKP